MSCPFTQCSNYNTCPVVNLEFPITQCGVYTARSFCPTLTNAQFPDEVALLSDNATFMRLYREVRIRFDTAPKNYQKQDYQRLLELFRFIDGVDSSFKKTEITTSIGLNAAIDPGAYSVVLPSVETTLGVTTFSMIVLPQDDNTLQIAYFINADGEAKMYERLITNGTPLVLGPWVDSDAHLINKINEVVANLAKKENKIHYVNKASGNGIYEKFAVEDSVVYVDLVPNLLEGFDPKTYVGLVSFCIEDFTVPVTGNEQIRFRWTNNDNTISTVRIYLSTGGYMPTNTPSIISDVFAKQVIALFAINEGKGSCLIGVERNNNNIAFQENTTETIDPYLETEHIYEVSDDTKENVLILSSGVGSSITFPLTLTTDKAIYITVSDGSEELLIDGVSAIEGDVFSAIFILSTQTWTISKLTSVNITDFSDVTVKQCNSNPNDELHLLSNTTVIYGLNMPLGSIVHAVGDLLLITNRADKTHQGLFEVLGYLGSYATHTMHVIRKIASAEQLNIVRVTEGINKGVWQSLYDGSNEESIRFINLREIVLTATTTNDTPVQLLDEYGENPFELLGNRFRIKFDLIGGGDSVMHMVNAYFCRILSALIFNAQMSYSNLRLAGYNLNIGRSPIDGIWFDISTNKMWIKGPATYTINWKVKILDIEQIN